jgi:hypothetical protein
MVCKGNCNEIVIVNQAQKKELKKLLFCFVGAAGFEPTTPSTPC